jgi:predicted nucleic acid-binding protein
LAGIKPKVIYFKSGGMVVRASQVYLDANFLVALSRPTHIWHTNAKALLASLQERHTKLNLSALAFNEAIYQLLRLAQRDTENPDTLEDGEPTPLFNTTSDTATASSNRHYASVLGRLDNTVLSLPDLQFFEPPNAKLHHRTLLTIVEFGLDPTDAFHYEAAHRLNCPIVTNDVQFQRIPDPNLTVVTFF